MPKPRISFIIFTYNAERTIEKCIESLLSSTPIPRREFELLLVDGISTDRTVEIAKRFKLDRIILKKSTRPEARNIGVKAAKSDFVCMLESDKVFTKQLFETALAAFENDKDLGFWGVTSITPFSDEIKKDFVKTVVFLLSKGEKHFYGKLYGG